jgi:hypothetical protein
MQKKSLQAQAYTATTGHPEKDRSGPQQEEEPRRESATLEKGTPGHRARPEALPRAPNQAQHHGRRGSAVDGS